MPCAKKYQSLPTWGEGIFKGPIILNLKVQRVAHLTVGRYRGLWPQAMVSFLEEQPQDFPTKGGEGADNPIPFNNFSGTEAGPCGNIQSQLLYSSFGRSVSPIDLSGYLQQKNNQSGFYTKRLKGFGVLTWLFCLNACILGKGTHVFKTPLLKMMGNHHSANLFNCEGAGPHLKDRPEVWHRKCYHMDLEPAIVHKGKSQATCWTLALTHMRDN